MALSVTTLTTGTQDGVVAGATPFTSATFNVAAGSIVVVSEVFESDLGNTPVITWTGGTPAGASAFVRQANNNYNDGVGDQQGAQVWTAHVGTALTAAGVTSTNSVSIANGIAMMLDVRQVSGGAPAPLVGGTGTGATTIASGNLNVSLTATGISSLIIGIVGSADFSFGTFAAMANTTADTNVRLATAGCAYVSCHATALTASTGSITIGGTNTNATFRTGAVIEILDGSRSQTETATASDAQASAQGFSATLLETVSPTDAYAASSPATGVSDSESASASEAFGVAMGASAAQADSAQAQDTYAAALGMPASQAESASASDGYSLQLAIAAAQAESTNCSVSFAAAQGFAVTYLEAASPSAAFDDGTAPPPHGPKALPFWPWWYRLKPLSRRRIM